MHKRKKEEGNVGRIIIAFPGVGKTTYALHNSGAIDLDFGNFRSALKINKQDEAKLLTPFSRLMKYYFKDGYDVLTNDPKLIPLAKQFAGDKIYVVLPLNHQEHVERVKQREERRHINADFPKELAEHIDEWTSDWEEIAHRYGIAVVRVKYLEDVL